jgi:hypothetical protein
MCAVSRETFSVEGNQEFLRQQTGLDGNGWRKLVSDLV